MSTTPPITLYATTVADPSCHVLATNAATGVLCGNGEMCGTVYTDGFVQHFCYQKNYFFTKFLNEMNGDYRTIDNSKIWTDTSCTVPYTFNNANYRKCDGVTTANCNSGSDWYGNLSGSFCYEGLVTQTPLREDSTGTIPTWDYSAIYMLYDGANCTDVQTWMAANSISKKICPNGYQCGALAVIDDLLQIGCVDNDSTEEYSATYTVMPPFSYFSDASCSMGLNPATFSSVAEFMTEDFGTKLTTCAGNLCNNSTPFLSKAQNYTAMQTPGDGLKCGFIECQSGGTLYPSSDMATYVDCVNKNNKNGNYNYLYSPLRCRYGEDESWLFDNSLKCVCQNSSYGAYTMYIKIGVYSILSLLILGTLLYVFSLVGLFTFRSKVEIRENEEDEETQKQEIERQNNDIYQLNFNSMQRGQYEPSIKSSQDGTGSIRRRI